MSPQFTSLVEKLKEIFQMDKPELDFGIYRILNSRRKQIRNFLDEQLADKVQTALSGNAAAENEVYSHLLTFFSRYYDKGDFISLRRYKGDTYAIPYNGEEVKLHWANADQYYVKSGENFTHYDFSLPNGAKVHFRLVSADLTKDNIKDNDAVRCFVLWDPAEAEGEEPGTYPATFLEEKGGGVVRLLPVPSFQKKGKKGGTSRGVGSSRGVASSKEVASSREVGCCSNSIPCGA